MPFNGFITGRVGVGKTTVCQRVVDLVRERDYAVSGILTPAEYGQDGSKTGISIVDLQTGTQRTLARIGQDLGGPQIGHYSFDPDALAWGCEVLDRASAGGCDLFVVDEIGPLELVKGQGFVRALAVLETDVLPRTLIVVRESYLQMLQRRLPHTQAAEFWVTEANRQEIVHQIADRLFLREAQENGNFYPGTD